MGINKSLISVKNDILQIKSELNVIGLMTEEERQNRLKRIVDKLDILSKDVDEISRENNDIKNELSNILDKII